LDAWGGGPVQTPPHANEICRVDFANLSINDAEWKKHELINKGVLLKHTLQWNQDRICLDDGK